MQIGYAADQHPRPHIGCITCSPAERRAKDEQVPDRERQGQRHVHTRSASVPRPRRCAGNGTTGRPRRRCHAPRRRGRVEPDRRHLDAGRASGFRYLLDGERVDNDWAADAYLADSFGGTTRSSNLTALAQAAPLEREEGTGKEGTGEEGTRRKGTRRKGTRRKGTSPNKSPRHRRKGTRRKHPPKSTRREGTRREGTGEDHGESRRGRDEASEEAEGMKR